MAVQAATVAVVPVVAVMGWCLVAVMARWLVVNRGGVVTLAAAVVRVQVARCQL